MSKYAFNTAIKYGEKLCGFNNLSEAEDYFILRKDFLLNKLKAVSTQTSAFVPDNTVESPVSYTHLTLPTKRIV